MSPDNHDHAIEYLQKFLELGIANNNKEKQGEAHKMLADIYSRSGQTAQAFQHLESVLEIAVSTEKKSAEADAALKLGLLYNQEGPERNIRKSSEFLQNHFDLLRGQQTKDQARLDAARVNLGIVQANIKIEQYKAMTLSNLQGLVDWKVRRDPKHLQ